MALCYIAPDQGSLGFGLPIARHVTGCTVAVQQPATWDVIPPQVTRVAWYECVAACWCVRLVTSCWVWRCCHKILVHVQAWYAGYKVALRSRTLDVS